MEKYTEKFLGNALALLQTVELPPETTPAAREQILKAVQQINYGILHLRPDAEDVIAKQDAMIERCHKALRYADGYLEYLQDVRDRLRSMYKQQSDPCPKQFVSLADLLGYYGSPWRLGFWLSRPRVLAKVIDQYAMRWGWYRGLKESRCKRRQRCATIAELSDL